MQALITGGAGLIGSNIPNSPVGQGFGGVSSTICCRVRPRVRKRILWCCATLVRTQHTRSLAVQGGGRR